MSSFALKILAVLSMLIDHIGYVFFPTEYIYRIIGRIAMPIFAFQIAIGFDHTTNREKYIFRMLLFAIVSQIPYQLITSIHGDNFSLNIGFTFLFALLLLYSLENIKPIFLKITTIIPIIFLAYFLNYDYWLYGVALVIIFFYSIKKPYIMIPLVFLVTSIYVLYKNSPFQLYSFVALAPLLFFNGKKGPSLKWLFYVFYPLHMLILYAIKLFL